MRSKRIDEFEGMRGPLALWVVLGHAANMMVLAVPAPLPRDLSGRSAVDVFIMLSGFVITLLLVEKREPFAPYLVRRFFRLFPVFFVCLVLSAALIPVATDALLAAPETPATPGRLRLLGYASDNLVAHFLAHLTMLHGLLDPVLQGATFTIVGQAWSISVEWQFYIWAPFVVRLFVQRKWLWALPVAAVPALYFAGATGSGFLSAHVHLFAIGMATYVLWRRLSSGALQWSALHVAGLSLAVLAVGWWILDRPAIVIWAIGSHIVLAKAAGVDGPAERAASSMLTSRPMMWLGRISYSVYLAHMIVLYPLLALCNRLRTTPGQQALCLGVGGVAGTLLLSAVLFRWVEIPGMRLGTQLSKRLPPSPASSAEGGPS